MTIRKSSGAEAALIDQCPQEVFIWYKVVCLRKLCLSSVQPPRVIVPLQKHFTALCCSRTKLKIHFYGVPCPSWSAPPPSLIYHCSCFLLAALSQAIGNSFYMLFCALVSLSRLFLPKFSSLLWGMGRCGWEGLWGGGSVGSRRILWSEERSNMRA